MSGTTLVRTTLTGVRPLGVRGEPLHHAEAQIRTVIRRRLGERHFHLLAEPEPHDLGGRIDWYSERAGAVRPLVEMADVERETARAEIDVLLADIDRLGQSLETAASEDARLAGRSLRLAAKRPSDDYLFMVGDQPVIVCWGYDTEAAGAVLPPAFLAGAPTVAAPPPATMAPAIPPPMLLAPGGAAAIRTRIPWLFWLLAGMLAILILLVASWLLRQCMPVPPDLRVTELPAPPSPPPAPPPPDPAVGMQGDIDAARHEEDRLRATLAALRDELGRRYVQCRPPASVPDRPPTDTKPGDVLKLPDKPTDDYSFLKGCWRGDQFRYTPRHPPGHHNYCFDEKGNGKLTFRWQSGVTCEAPATARYEGTTLRITDADATCSDGSRWTQDRLVCRAGAGNVAQCSGETSMHLPDQGVTRDRPTQFTVRLTKE